MTTDEPKDNDWIDGWLSLPVVLGVVIAEAAHYGLEWI